MKAKINIWESGCIIAPSLITLDLCNLEAQVRELEENGAEVLHVDLLDGYFSPSMPIGLDVVKQLRKKTKLQFDVHLMVNAQDYFIDELLDIGVEQLVFHGECEPHIDNRLNMIHNAGVRAGVALKPASSLSCLDYVIEKCDTVLLMLINPGYAGNSTEKQVVYADRKIRELRELICKKGLNTKIEIDGRISQDNLGLYKNGVVDIFVAGSTLIKKDNIKDSMEKIKNILLTV